MKKYLFLVYHREYNDFLLKMGNLGVLHLIEQEQNNYDQSLEEKEKHLKRLGKTLDLLKSAVDENGGVSPVIPESKNPEYIISLVENLNTHVQKLNKEIDELNSEILRNLPWGVYTKNDFKALTDKGYAVYMYKCQEKGFDPVWQSEYIVHEIHRAEGQVWFLVLAGKNDKVNLNAELFTPSKLSVNDLKNEQETKISGLKKVKEQLAGLALALTDDLNALILHHEREIELQKAYNMAVNSTGDKLKILEGWVPEEAEEELLELLEKENIVSIEAIPEKGDKPPIKLRNSKFSRLFEPISNLFELPSYKELDLTPYFAPFFMIFFGFCLGDAGYGVFFILLASILKLKINRKFRPIMSMAQYLGIATIVFGLLSGTFFGINLIDSGYTITERSVDKLKRTEMPAHILSEIQNLEGEYFKNREDFIRSLENHAGAEELDKYKAEILRTAESGIPLVGNFRHLMQDPKSMFYLSIIIGGLQILFGMFLRVLNISRQQGFRYALSTVGWLILIINVGLYYLGVFNNKHLSILFYIILGVSGIFIFLLNNPDINVFLRIGHGIWGTYGMLTGLFGDLLSYIRLFALGISSAILGFVFNDISLQLLNVPYIGWLLFLILLLIGHSINLFMATLGAFIHPMRLTFVEFYKNAGFQGGGKKYNPFRLTNNN